MIGDATTDDDDDDEKNQMNSNILWLLECYVNN